MHSPRPYVLTLLASIALLCVACHGTEPPTPRALEKLSGDEQAMRTGEPVPIPLRVRVVGDDQRPIQGISVQWSVTSGSATLAPAQSMTDNNGETETRVVLQGVGDVLIAATVPSVAPVTFTLEGLDPCIFGSWPTITAGVSITGTLLPSDCVTQSGRFLDLYPFSLDSQQAIALELESTAFDPQLELYSNAPWHAFFFDTVNASRHVRRKVILPANPYGLVASPIEGGSTGSYTIRLSLTSESEDACEFVMVMVGVGTNQTLAPSDCAGPSGRYEDQFWLVLAAGELVTLAQASVDFTPYIRLTRSGLLVAESQGTSTSPATITFRSSALSEYYVHTSSASAQQSGSYTLSISPGSPANLLVSTPRGIRLLGGGAHEGARAQSPNRTPAPQKAKDLP